MNNYIYIYTLIYIYRFRMVWQCNIWYVLCSLYVLVSNEKHKPIYKMRIKWGSNFCSTTLILGHDMALPIQDPAYRHLGRAIGASGADCFVDRRCFLAATDFKMFLNRSSHISTGSWTKIAVQIEKCWWHQNIGEQKVQRYCQAASLAACGRDSKSGFAMVPPWGCSFFAR